MVTASKPPKVKPDFRFYLRTKAATEDAQGRPTVTVTASSDEVDLGNDRFALSALKQMVQAFEGLTIFLNHRYAVPEDVFGTVASAELHKRQGFTDLDLVIAVEESSQRAMSTYAMIKNGTRLGVSVGVLVKDAEYQGEDEDKILEITDIIPLEASIVGIPANRRSWVHGARKAASLLVARDPDEDDDDDDDEEEEDDMAYFSEDPRLLITAADEVHAVHTDEEEPDAIKGVVGSHRPPTMDQGTAWSGSEAVNRMRKWASSDGSGSKEKMNWGKYKSGFVWFDDNNKENFGGYKMPHHDIADGTLKTHYRGCVAAAVVLSGGRGGVAIPEGDMAGCKTHIATHYHQYDQKAPWEREKGAEWLDIEQEVAAELGIELKADAEEIATVADLLGQIANAPIVDVTGEEEHKGLREDYAADTFCGEVFSLFRSFYYGLYDIIASEDTSGAEKRSMVGGLLTELQDMILEALDKTLEYLDEAKEKGEPALAALGERDKAVRGLLSAAEDGVKLLDAFAVLTAEHTSLKDEREKLAQELKEKEALLAECVAYLQRLMDMPLARKITDEQVVGELTERFPWLHPWIATELARRREQ
jgi:phage head maturation protease